jgi:uncharacterized protein YndB with AHSA1/START domain
MPDDVTTHLDKDTVSATAVIDAPPEAVFDFLRRPANHPVISGDQTVRGTTKGPEQLTIGDHFGMKMKLGVPYRVQSEVVEFEENRLIAWCHIGGHRWRWELEPAAGGKTTLTETYDQTTSRFPPALRLVGYPKRHESNVASSVANVRDHFAGTAGS